MILYTLFLKGQLTSISIKKIELVFEYLNKKLYYIIHKMYAFKILPFTIILIVIKQS